MPPIRVVLGEDNFLVREAVSSVLKEGKNVELVAACEDLDSLRAAIDTTEPDVVVTDIRMPPGHLDEGIRLAKELRVTHPEVGVVVLSQFAEATYATLLFESGSDRRAYLLKERVRDRGQLIHSIEAVAAGGSVVDPLVVDQLMAAHSQRQESKVRGLTPRETEVLAMIAEGRSNAAIAENLAVTKRAVERHVNGIFLKLGLQGDAGDVSRRVSAALIYLTDRSAT